MTSSESGFDPFLVSMGWNQNYQASFTETDAAEFQAGRIVGQGKGHYHLQLTPDSTHEAAITKKFYKSIRDASEYPTVGDWVTYKPGVGSQQASIHRVLKRKSLLQRHRTGSANGVQLIAANLDHMCVVTSCNEDFDLARLGRYLALAKGTDIRPILLLTKADLTTQPEHFVEQLKAAFEGVDIFVLSNERPESLQQLEEFFAVGKTTVLLGSSGVGKSTLTNFLLGSDSQKTQATGAESRGRHTTTARSLRFTRWGGIVIDTPGMQEISEEAREEDLSEKFGDLEDLTLTCKFTNCLHKNEPGCAVQKALKSGTVTQARWDAYSLAASVQQRVQSKRSR